MSRCWRPMPSQWKIRWPSVRGAKGFVSQAFDDPRALVAPHIGSCPAGLLRVHLSQRRRHRTQHERGARGGDCRPSRVTRDCGRRCRRPEPTLHFRYLLEEEGGCVRVARSLDEHASQLTEALQTPNDGEQIRRFAAQFLRPNGIDRAVSPLFADAIEHACSAGRAIESSDPAAVTQA